MLIRICLTVACALASFHTTAQEAAACKKAQVFYVNGVANPKGWSPTEGSVELSEALNEGLKAEGFPQIVNVRTIWNEGDGILKDLEEVGLSVPVLGSAIGLLESFFKATIPTSLITNLLDYVDNPAATERRKKSINKVKAIILAEVRDNQVPVVVLAHSQGNIIVNRAVEELQAEFSSSVPQIMNVAIVGIGVADRTKPGQLYSYITSASDYVISAPPLSLSSITTGILVGNFVTESANLSLPQHSLVDVYLNPQYRGFYKGRAELQSSRQVVAELFLNAYKKVNAAWPCVTITADPNPSRVDSDITFDITVKARSGDIRKPVGFATAHRPAEPGIDRANYCFGTLDALGKATCKYLFTGEIRTEKVVATYAPTLASDFEVTTSPVYLVTLTDYFCVERIVDEVGSFSITRYCFSTPDGVTEFERTGKFTGPCDRYIDSIGTNRLEGIYGVNRARQQIDRFGRCYPQTVNVSWRKSYPDGFQNTNPPIYEHVNYNGPSLDGLFIISFSLDDYRNSNFKHLRRDTLGNDMNLLSRTDIVCNSYLFNAGNYISVTGQPTIYDFPRDLCPKYSDLKDFVSTLPEDLPLLKKYGFYLEKR